MRYSFTICFVKLDGYEMTKFYKYDQISYYESSNYRLRGVCSVGQNMFIMIKLIVPLHAVHSLFKRVRQSIMTRTLSVISIGTSTRQIY